MVDPGRPSAPGSESCSSTAGVALVLVLMLLLSLTVLGHGVFVLARAEARGAEALGRATRGRLLARAWLDQEFRRAVGDTFPTLAVAASDTVTPTSGHTAVLERLSSELYLLTTRVEETDGAPRSAPVSTAVRSGVAWAADPVARVARVVAALSAGGEVTGAERVNASDFFEMGPLDSPWCDRFTSALDSLSSVRPLPDPVAPLALDPGATGPPGPAARAALTVGKLEMDTLRVRLDSYPGGVVTPSASPGFVDCYEEQDNWGTPSAPEGPCGDRRVAHFVNGDLTIEGGEGQGFLAVTGDLALRSGATFSGFVAVGGVLELREGTLIRGVVRVGDRVTISSDAAVIGAACPVASAIDAATGLLRPIRLPAPLSSLH